MAGVRESLLAILKGVSTNVVRMSMSKDDDINRLWPDTGGLYVLKEPSCIWANTIPYFFLRMDLRMYRRYQKG